LTRPPRGRKLAPMRRRKKSQVQGLFDAAPFLAGIRGIVDPVPLIDAEFARAKRELLATAERDMSRWERIRFRLDLWRLKRRFDAMKRDAATW
jgi:hypothetical protein